MRALERRTASKGSFFMKSITWIAPAVVLTSLSLSCGDARLPLQPTAPGSAFDIQDGAHPSGNPGNPHLFFLPPMVPQPEFTGRFDSSESPTVVVCWWTGTACGTVVAQFSMTSGTGSQVVRVDPTGEAYSVSWDTKQCAKVCKVSRIFRVSVLVARTVLGYADVKLVAEQNEANAVNRDEFVPLVAGRKLTIKFRIEVDAVYVVGPSAEPQTIQTPTNAAGSSVSIAIPPDAVSQPTGLTVEAAALPAGTSTTALVGGTAYDLGPAGTTFSMPVTVTIQYDPANMPAGTAEGMLRLFTLVNGVWQLVPRSTANTSAHAVSAVTKHFSTYGVMASATVSAGGFHSCGIGTSGTTVCWGYNYAGQLGDGSTNTSAQPTQVSTPPGVMFTAVSAGFDHSCGVASGGDPDVGMYCWGGNSWGQLGDGTNTSSPTPAAVRGGHTFAAVSAGPGFTCAVESSGATVFCWGANRDGELGNGTSTGTASQGGILSPPGVGFLAVTTSGQPPDSVAHACALTLDGAAYCWGSSRFGELGTGGTSAGGCLFDATCETVPVAVAGGISFQSISAGALFTCGVDMSGKAYCWGSNWAGQLGNGMTGTPAFAPTPVSMPPNVTFTTVTAGESHACALTTGGTAYCWGSNYSGQLGDGSIVNQPTPVPVQGGITFTLLSAGAAHTCGISSAPEMNTAYCWGSNYLGQLGDGSTSDRTTPMRVFTP